MLDKYSQLTQNTGKSFSVTANLQKVFSLLKAQTPEVRQVQTGKQNKHTKFETKPVHILDSRNRGRSRVRSAPSIAKKKPVPIPVPQEERLDTNENLLQMLGILEEEFRQLKDQYNSLVKQYEVVAESMTHEAIAKDSGTATLKAIGDDLTHCIQSMETKVYYSNSD